MKSVTNSKIFVIYDEPRRKRASQVADILGAHSTSLEETNPQIPQDMNAAIVYAELADAAHVARLKGLFSRVDTAAPKLFLVESGARLHFYKVQVAALGGEYIVRGEQDARAILLALKEHKVRLIKPAPKSEVAPEETQQGGMSIRATATAIDAAFGAVLNGGPLDVSVAMAAGNQLLADIDAVGLSSWLENVRDHHEGTFQHCLLVAGAAAAYAAQANLSDADKMELAVAALLHDIGKAAIPLAILEKAGKLTEKEFALIKTHPVVAGDYLKRNQNVSEKVISAILHHHEYLDGSGYPHQLKGKEIDKLTRILTVCDIYGALAERRSYKEPKTPAQAIQILMGMARGGKVDFDAVCTMALAVGVDIPENRASVA